MTDALHLGSLPSWLRWDDRSGAIWIYCSACGRDVAVRPADVERDPECAARWVDEHAACGARCEERKP